MQKHTQSHFAEERFEGKQYFPDLEKCYVCRLKIYLGNLEAEMFEEVEARMKMISDVPRLKVVVGANVLTLEKPSGDIRRRKKGRQNCGFIWEYFGASNYFSVLLPSLLC